MMHLSEFTIGEGIPLHVLTRTAFKTECLQIIFHVPLQAETAAHYALLPAVLGRGCRLYPDMEQLSAHLDGLYNAQASCDTVRLGEGQEVSFYARALDTAYVPGGEDVFFSTMETLAELMLHPLTCQKDKAHEDGKENRRGFLSSYTQGEKQNAIDTVRSLISHKTAYASMRCIDAMCAEEAFSAGNIREKGIDEITEESLYAAYRAMLSHAPVDIYYVGARSPNVLVSQLSLLFAGLFPYRTPPFWQTKTVVRRVPAGEVRYVCENQPAGQSRLNIGCRTGAVLADGDFYIFALFHELFGGAPSSRLFLKLREEMNLCYDCASVCEAHKGIMQISCGIGAAQKEAALTAVFSELSDLAGGHITDEEFHAAQRSLTAGYRAIEDSPSSLITWYNSRRAADIHTSPEEAAEQVLQVTKEALAHAAAFVHADTVFFMNGTGSPAETADEEDFNDV